MAAASGSSRTDLVAPDVAQRLHEEPYYFQFFQAVRLLQLLYPERTPVGTNARKPGEEVVRFRANPTSAFPASELVTLEQDPHTQQLAMTVNFMGTVGPLGALPLYYTELIAAEDLAGNSAPRDFLDVFHHRIISLFFQAWCKYRVFEHAGGMDECLRSLIGIQTAGLQKPTGLAQTSLMYYAGLLSRQARSAAALQNLLMDYYGVAVEIEEFAGEWCSLTRDEQSWIEDGMPETYQLGRGTVLGDEVWEPQARARVVLGPLTLEQYLEFLPGGSANRSLRGLLRFFSGDDMAFELQLVLLRVETPGCQLGKEGDDAPRLGLLSWVKSPGREFPRNPGDAILQL